MSKELTAMQVLIEEIDICISNLGRKNDLLTGHQRARLVDAKLIAKRLLQKEQEQIEQAYEKGVTDFARYDPERHGNKFPNGKDYYQSKYGGEDVDK